ncbi:MAG: DUF86 domain-containing protein [Deltaproteobacteria bacterium]|nr:DUF86 domain-containing protein [Deltaproteobacteria bacterium]
MKREYKLFLKDIVKACEYIQEFVEGIDFDQFLKDEKTSSAVIQKFGIIGEAVKNIPEFIKQKYPDIAWKDMAGMRDRLIHGYFGVDYVLVWDTIESDIPEIISSISQILDHLEKEQNVGYLSI